MDTFLYIILIHWIADFIFQDEKWATKKSYDLISLSKHTTVYSLVCLILVFMVTGSVIGTVIFSLITFVFHTLTDFFTSKIVSKKFTEKEYGSPIPNFGAFTVIGFDQVLHYFQLIITWSLVFGI